MGTKNANTHMPLLYSFDGGNGGCQAVTNARRELIEFEPILAQISDKRGLESGDEKPQCSIRVDGQTLVVGVDDVFKHGKRTSARRLNAQDRYTNADYFTLLDVLYLQAFAAYRGSVDYIAPTGAISLPVEQYNNAKTVEQVRNTVVGKRTICDYDGCELRLDIQSKRLLIVPESYGSLIHYAYDPKTLKRRSTAVTNGTVLVIDVGYETTDTSLYEAEQYQRDRAFSLPRMGMGIVARAISEYARKVVRDADVSRIDRAMRALAGVPMGAKKQIEITPGVHVDVTDVYDTEITNLVNRIAQEVATLYPEAVSRVLFSGGGAYHAAAGLEAALDGWKTECVADPETANVVGSFTALQMKAAR